jgi:hypothetical protein
MRSIDIHKKQSMNNDRLFQIWKKKEVIAKDFLKYKYSLVDTKNEESKRT